MKNLQISINNFDNQAMVDNPQEEVIEILRNLILEIEFQGLDFVDDRSLRDSNGNTVGNLTVN